LLEKTMLRSVLLPSLALATALSVAAPVVAQGMRPEDVNRLPTRVPHEVHRYGPAPQQYGQLRLPEGAGPFPVAVVVHGGCWTKGFATLANTAPLASSLAERGIASWNIEYRQLGEPGAGWPGTFQDWGAATDALRELAARHPLDLGRVVTVGHSAGAHAALWIATRQAQPDGTPLGAADPLPVHGAVAVDGPGDLAAFVGRDAMVCGQPVISNLFGGAPDEVPDRFAAGSPAERLPFGVRQVLVASVVLTPDAAKAYAAKAAGDEVTVVTLHDVGHFEMIAPGQPSAAKVIEAVETLVEPR
jgi:acetyl esterase/lipase